MALILADGSVNAKKKLKADQVLNFMPFEEALALYSKSS
jgi:hypothetical protein